MIFVAEMLMLSGFECDLKQMGVDAIPESLAYYAFEVILIICLLTLQWLKWYFLFRLTEVAFGSLAMSGF
ncbi:MAG: hypothetical protein EA343_09080 [Nodularia sp. (in: Bacteria)]|nr:MAG: hypothetical protein EA343_09080 [Nodularia sp. (in: cyanobacteria)]